MRQAVEDLSKKYSHGPAKSGKIGATIGTLESPAMSLWLTREELVELTGFKSSRRQKLALTGMGLVFRSRPADGFPLVDRWQFEGELNRPHVSRRHPGPNWNAIASGAEK
jgi:Domain of unknown function (DUF4224)